MYLYSTLGKWKRATQTVRRRTSLPTTILLPNWRLILMCACVNTANQYCQINTCLLAVESRKSFTGLTTLKIRSQWLHNCGTTKKNQNINFMDKYFDATSREKKFVLFFQEKIMNNQQKKKKGVDSKLHQTWLVYSITADNWRLYLVKYCFQTSKNYFL